MPERVPFPLPPGMLDDAETDDEVAPLMQAPRATPQPPTTPYPGIVPSIVFPSGNKVPIQDLTRNDIRLPMVGDRIMSVLQQDLDVGGYVIPAGVVAFRKIRVAGLGRFVPPQPGRQGFWLFLVEVTDPAGVDDELIWITASAQGTVDGKVVWEALPT